VTTFYLNSKRICILEGRSISLSAHNYNKAMYIDYCPYSFNEKEIRFSWTCTWHSNNIYHLEKI